MMPSKEESSELHFAISTYNSIFSDFDPRPYSERALSRDFLGEAERASKDKDHTIELNLFVPAKHRNLHEESVIKKRLKDHFKRHHHQLEVEKRKVYGKGFLFALTGVLLMFIATFLLFQNHQQSILLTFLVVLLEPAGWFTFWEGLYLIVLESRKVHPEREFYRKMTGCEIRFRDS